LSSTISHYITQAKYRRTFQQSLLTDSHTGCDVSSVLF
jgi:hypothetical protein